MLKKAFLILAVFCAAIFEISAQDASSVKQVSKGVVNGSAISLPKPVYPAAARAVGAEGAVNVQVVIDEAGTVINAEAVSGHPLLRQAAEQAALAARFRPTLLSGNPVKVTGVIIYNFVPLVPDWKDTGANLAIAEKKGLSYRINLPDEFFAESRQLESLEELSPDEQAPHIANTIAVIRSKLSDADRWRFEFGLAKGRIIGSSDDDSRISLSLAKIKELAFDKVPGVQKYELERAAEIAKFADKGVLTAEDREKLITLLQ